MSHIRVIGYPYDYSRAVGGPLRLTEESDKSTNRMTNVAIPPGKDMTKYGNGSSLHVDSSLVNYGKVAGLLEDMIGSVEPPFEVSLSVVSAMGSTVSVEMSRSGPFHAEIIVNMGNSWDNGAPGEWKRAARAIAGYMFSSSSRPDVSHWMQYIDDHPVYGGGSDSPYND